MAVGIHLLTDRHIKNATKPTRDGGNLWIYPKGNARSWIFRYRLNGRSREMGLGGYPETTLRQARSEAATYREVLAAGRDPIDHRDEKKCAEAIKRAGVPTFTQMAARYIRAHRHGWKNAKHAQQWVRTLKTYARPIIGAKPIDAIVTADILQVLSGLWVAKTETANRLRGRIEKILDFSAAQKLREKDNPARWQGHLNQLLAPKSRVARVIHHPAMPYAEVPNLMAELRMSDCPAAQALSLLILTATRTGEVLGAQWDEIYIADATWIIPGARMKSGIEHRIPLSAAALAILTAQPRLGDNPYIFPGYRYGRPLSDMALLKALRDLGYGVRGTRGHYVPHGFRSSFRDWSGEIARYPRDVCEMALAHAVESQVEAAYRRGDLFDRRRELMDDWAAWCGTDPRAGAAVISFQERRRAATR